MSATSAGPGRLDQRMGAYPRSVHASLTLVPATRPVVDRTRRDLHRPTRAVSGRRRAAHIRRHSLHQIGDPPLHERDPLLVAPVLQLLLATVGADHELILLEADEHDRTPGSRVAGAALVLPVVVLPDPLLQRGTMPAGPEMLSTGAPRKRMPDS